MHSIKILGVRAYNGLASFRLQSTSKQALEEAVAGITKDDPDATIIRGDGSVHIDHTIEFDEFVEQMQDQKRDNFEGADAVVRDLFVSNNIIQCTVLLNDYKEIQNDTTTTSN